MNILEDIWAIISSLSIVDYILYFGIITLICLVISLIYILKTEKLEQEDKDVFEEGPLETSKDEEIDLQNIVNIIDENPKPLVDMTAYEEEQEQKAIISYDELIKAAQAGSLSYDNEELVDDVIPVKKIQVSPMELPKLKENESVISSLELPQKEPKLEVDTVVSPTPTTAQVKLFSYEKEEAFLKALQQLSELLNDT
ncbi:TPA: hypothetical protein IAB29_06295 [Candidatus Ventrenecus stercoripullorum]|nr:hypothetical protein [Candidatus Ventrenecus stercoripullorum]